MSDRRVWNENYGLEMREPMSEFILALDAGDVENAVVFLGDAIREVRPDMKWDESDSLARGILLVPDEEEVAASREP